MQRTSPSFNLQGTYDNHSNSHLSSLSSSPQPQSQNPNQARPFAVKTKKDQENEALAQLFAEREGGQDTFGNVGALRYLPDYETHQIVILIFLYQQIWLHRCRTNSHFAKDGFESQPLCSAAAATTTTTEQRKTIF